MQDSIRYSISEIIHARCYNIVFAFRYVHLAHFAALLLTVYYRLFLQICTLGGFCRTSTHCYKYRLCFQICSLGGFGPTSTHSPLRRLLCRYRLRYLTVQPSFIKRAKMDSFLSHFYHYFLCMRRTRSFRIYSQLYPILKLFCFWKLLTYSSCMHTQSQTSSILQAFKKIFIL